MVTIGLDLSMRILPMYFQLQNMRCPCIAIWFNLLIHRTIIGLWEIHYGKQPCRRSMTHSYKTSLGIWFHVHQKGIFLGVAGSIGSRGTRPDRLPKDFIRSINISTSSQRLSMSRSFRLCGIILQWRPKLPSRYHFLLLIHYLLRGGFVPTWFSLFAHFYSMFISFILHEYLKWPSSRDSFFTPQWCSGGVLEKFLFSTH